MHGRRTILVVLLYGMMALLPVSMIAGEEEPSGEGGSVAIPMFDPWWPYPGHFNYSDGKAVGNYLSFEINESTGIVTKYTVTISTYDIFYPLLVYEEKWYIDEYGEIIMEPEFPELNLTYENITVFESIEIEDFTPVGYPGTFVDLLLFQGEQALMMFYDREWNQGFYASGDMNNTIIFNVAEGLEILEFPYDWYDDWYYEEDEWGERWKDPNFIEDDVYRIPWTEIWIESENTTTSIWINDGNATITNNTVTILLNANGYLDISTWANQPFYPVLDEVWYSDVEFEEEMELIEMGIEEGFIAGEGWYFELEGFQENGYYNFEFDFYGDTTFNMELIKLGDERFDFLVDSQIPEGRVVTINLNKEALEAGSIDELLVRLDGDKIEATRTLEELMGLTNDGEAKFFPLFSDDGTKVFVYVPHFSIHTITIESVLSTTPNILVPGVLALLFIAVATFVVLLRGRKADDEY